MVEIYETCWKKLNSVRRHVNGAADIQIFVRKSLKYFSSIFILHVDDKRREKLCNFQKEMLIIESISMIIFSLNVALLVYYFGSKLHSRISKSSWFSSNTFENSASSC